MPDISLRNPKHLLIVLLYLGTLGGLFAQQGINTSPFSNIYLRIDTLSFNWQEHSLTHQGQEQLAFRYRDPSAVASISLTVQPGVELEHYHLLDSDDYRLLDSLYLLDNELRFRVRFNNLANSEFLRLALEVATAGNDSHRIVLPLFPYTETSVQLHLKNEQLFVGEEKVVELLTNRPENIVAENIWIREQPIHYRLEREGSRILLHLLPQERGSYNLRLPVELKNPGLTNGKPQYRVILEQSFEVKTGRLAFLSLDRQEVTFVEGSTQSIEVQIDDHRLLEMEKTYRIENQEEPGGPLIAELFTKSKLNNDRVLCLLRPYAYHRKTEGYLYIKDGDRPRFITNFNITPKTKIEKIFLQREGEEWQQSNKVYPGEVVNVRFEGQGLHKGDFSFYGAPLLVGDTLVRNEDVAYFRIKVPLDISIRRIEIFNQNKNTGKSLQVNEYHRPRPFDFIDIQLGVRRHQLNQVTSPIYYENTLQDVVIRFDQRKIDRPGNLNGKQHLRIRVKISNKHGNLIELYEFTDVVICPGDNSPRFVYYDEQNCRLEDINLNNYIARKTHDLPEWAQIELEFSHDKDQYGGEGMTKRIAIILKRHLNFDIDVSFPAGLLILKAGENDFSNFGGISFAMIAQLSFYHPEKIAKYRPWKIGAGFIALDAFNLSEDNTNRDLGLVILGSLYPTSSENKLSFPLFAGYGFLLKQQKGFFLIGPGIRVRL